MRARPTGLLEFRDGWVVACRMLAGRRKPIAYRLIDRQAPGAWEVRELLPPPELVKDRLNRIEMTDDRWLLVFPRGAFVCGTFPFPIGSRRHYLQALTLELESECSTLRDFWWTYRVYSNEIVWAVLPAEAYEVIMNWAVATGLNIVGITMAGLLCDRGDHVPTMYPSGTWECAGQWGVRTEKTIDGREKRLALTDSDGNDLTETWPCYTASPRAKIPILKPWIHPNTDGQRHRSGSSTWHWSLLGVGGTLLVALCVGTVVLRQNVTKLDRRATELRRQLTLSRAQLEERSRTHFSAATVGGMDRNLIDPSLYALRLLTRILPSAVQLDRIVVDTDGRITLSGWTPSTVTLLQTLNASGVTENVDILEPIVMSDDTKRSGSEYFRVQLVIAQASGGDGE